MPKIELDLSPEVFDRWQSFLISEPAGRLKEAGQLGDWVALGFMSHVERYLKKGTPLSREETLRREKEREAATARKRLSKPQKRVLPMFNENDQVTASEVSRLLGVMPREGEDLVRQWVAEGFLAPGEGRDGEPTFSLGKAWVAHNLAANRPSLNVLRVPHLMRPVDQLGPEEED